MSSLNRLRTVRSHTHDLDRCLNRAFHHGGWEAGGVKRIVVFKLDLTSIMLESLKVKLKRLKRKNSLLFFETPRTGSNSIGSVCRLHGIQCHGQNRRGEYKFLHQRDDIEERFVF